MDKLKSRKLILAILTSISIWASVLLGVEISVEQLAAIVSPIVAYILGEAYVDSQWAKYD